MEISSLKLSLNMSEDLKINIEELYTVDKVSIVLTFSLI